MGESRPPFQMAPYGKGRAHYWKNDKSINLSTNIIIVNRTLNRKNFEALIPNKMSQNLHYHGSQNT